MWRLLGGWNAAGRLTALVNLISTIHRQDFMPVESAKSQASEDRHSPHARQLRVAHRADAFVRHELTSVPLHVSADGFDALIPPQLRTVAAKGGAATSGMVADSASGS